MRGVGALDAPLARYAPGTARAARPRAAGVEVGAGALGRDDGLFVNINTPHDDARARDAVMLEPFADRITDTQ